MHPRSLRIVAFALFASLVCSALLALRSTPLPAPFPETDWDSMGLPLDGGVVVHADEANLTVRFSGDRVGELVPGIDATLEASGWLQIAEADRGDSHLLTYQKGGATLVAALTTARGITVAQLSLR